MDPFAELWGPPKAAAAGPLTLNLIKGFEGFAPTAKWDIRQHSGGYGTRAQPGERFTPETAQARLEQEVAPIDSWLTKNVAVPMNPNQRAALTSFGFNLGVDDLEKLKGDINAGSWQTVGNRMLSFNKALNEDTGQLEPLAGLTNRRRKEAALVTGGEMPETTPMAQPQTGPLTSSFRDSLPQALGGSDRPGYFSQLMENPMFLMGLSTLGAGLSGQDAGAGMMRGAQVASTMGDMSEKRRRAAHWQKLMSGQGGAALEGIPPDILEIMRGAGPEEGMKMLGQLAMERSKRNAPREMAPGATLYDPTKNEAIFTAPTSKQSPFDETVQRERGKAFVDAEGRTKVGGQMITLFDEIKKLAGAPGSEEAQIFEDTVGPQQGTSLYQGVKGFINSEAKTPQVFNEIQQYAGTIRMLAQRAYLSGQGQVTEAERKAVNDAIGAVERAPSREAALRAVDTAQSIIRDVFMKPGAEQAPPVPGDPAAAGAGMPNEIAAPGLAVQGGMPQPETPPAGQQPGQGAPGAPITATGPNGEKIQLDPSTQQWGPVQTPAAQQPAPLAAGGIGAPAGAAQADRGPFTGVRANGPAWVDRWVLRAEAKKNPKIIEQFNNAFGPGAAERVLSGPETRPQGNGQYRSNIGTNVGAP